MNKEKRQVFGKIEGIYSRVRYLRRKRKLGEYKGNS